MTNDERLDHINKTMQAISIGWPFLLVEIKRAIDAKTLALIAQNNDETRGAIKALRDLTNLPEALQHEREALAAELPETDSAFE